MRRGPTKRLTQKEVDELAKTYYTKEEKRAFTKTMVMKYTRELKKKLDWIVKLAEPCEVKEETDPEAKEEEEEVKTSFAHCSPVPTRKTTSQLLASMKTDGGNIPDTQTERTELLLKSWHGPDFYRNFANGDHITRNDITISYSPGGADVAREVQHWVAAANKPPRFSLGLPAGLEVDLDGLGLKELPKPCIMAEYKNNAKGHKGFFLCRVGNDEWIAPY